MTTPVRHAVDHELWKVGLEISLLRLRVTENRQMKPVTGPEITVELRKLQERLGVLAMQTEGALTDEVPEE